MLLYTVHAKCYLKFLEDIREPQFVPPIADCCLIDGAAFDHIHPTFSSKMYGQYCKEELQMKLCSILFKFPV